jgi:hypothetical protein
VTTNLPLLISIQLGLSLAAGLTIGRSLSRRIIAGIILTVALLFPLAAHLPLERSGLTLLALIALIKSSIIATSKDEWLTPGRRIWQVLVPFDVRLTRRISPGVELSSLLRIVMGAAVATLMLWYGITRTASLPGAGPLFAQMACALITAYALMEVVGELFRTLHRVAGVDVSPLQRDPILSCSVSEFWGERWNLPITRWLNEFFFRPWVRRGYPVTGITLAFMVSTALHAWLFFAVTGGRGALLAASFFLVQIPAVILERSFSIRQWPPVFRRLWTLGFLLITSPLFVWPLVRGVEMQLAGK